MSTADDRFGTVTRNGEGFDLQYVRHIRAPIERVWAAITTPERIAMWFATADVQIEMRLGGAYRLRFGDEGPYAEGEITAFDPPRLLEHTWPDPPHPQGRVRYELEAVGEACILRLTSIGVPAPYIGSLAGWHIFLDAIGPSLEGVPVSWTMEAESELMDVYKARLPWLREVG